VEIVEAWASVASPELEVVARPLSDGGDGFIDVVRYYRPHVLDVRARVRDPLGRSTDAQWGWDPEHETVYLESAAAVGLANLGPAERNPLDVDSFGVGQLIACAGGLGARRLVIGLGGSATVDGGFGMARALGYRFRDRRGGLIVRTGDLANLARIEPPDERLLTDGVEVTAVVDVTNPLLGPSGAAAVFGPQKGADRAATERLETGLTVLASRWIADLGVSADVVDSTGHGAAGGLGAGCRAFLGAQIALGAQWVTELARLGKALDRADGVVTGEGRFDDQSGSGKVIGYVVDEASRRTLPAVVICASSTLTQSPLGATIVAGGRISKPRPAAELSLADLIELFRVAVAELGF
jgi:glycerate kinase